MEELARLLEIPCFSLETSKLDMDDCNSLERVASELLTAVKEVAPDGPVLLGGLGFGCRIAFEMALQMEAERGEEVKETKTRLTLASATRFLAFECKKTQEIAN